MLPPASEPEKIPIREDVSRLYRAEALEHYQRGRTEEANLLELEPRWMRWAYRVVAALVIAAALFGVWWVHRG